MSKYEANNRLHEILEEIEELGNEARAIFRENFPDLVDQGDAYGVFTLGRSWNRFDTTLETLVDAAFEEEMED